MQFIVLTNQSLIFLAQAFILKFTKVRDIYAIATYELAIIGRLLRSHLIIHFLKPLKPLSCLEKIIK